MTGGLIVMDRRAGQAGPGTSPVPRAEEAIDACAPTPLRCSAGRPRRELASLTAFASLRQTRRSQNTKRAARAAVQPPLLGASNARVTSPAPGPATSPVACGEPSVIGVVGIEVMAIDAMVAIPPALGVEVIALRQHARALEAAVRLESSHARMVAARRARRPVAVRVALCDGEERSARLGARSALPFSFSPRLSERSERSERSEFRGASLARAPQRTRRAAPGVAPAARTAAGRLARRATANEALHDSMEQSR